ncbi:SDR family oxidoreductase [Phytohalomonas tamaricis]|uniref:SDR family oxidoreductase n=1 Tax=Phytohalomonas tamaricis TaxID=2081032 RepID=UPI000D0B816B|nr:SDR family oxidoreductase [Phytohalomonas tamaricis]
MKKHHLANATVVIVGASSGIGRATAHEFARHGAHLILASRDKRALKQVARECDRLGGDTFVVPTDVGNSEALQRLAETAADVGGGIDVWINNAGVGAVGHFDRTPLQAHEKVVDTNLLGYMRGTYAVLPYFKRQRHGTLINTLSLGSWVPQPYASAYTASKFGLRGFIETLRGELSRWPDIHVCDIFPAFIDTPGFRDGANFIQRTIRPAPPVYDARKVAREMVKLVQHPRSTLTVGRSVVLLDRLMHGLMPNSFSKGSTRMMDAAFEHAKPKAASMGNLYTPPESERRIDGGWRMPTARYKGIITGGLLGAAVGLYLYKKSLHSK